MHSNRHFGKEITNLPQDKTSADLHEKPLLPEISKIQRGLSQQQPKPKCVKKTSQETAQSVNLNPKKSLSQHSDISNVQFVPEYLESSIAHMLALEAKDYNITDYMAEQKQIQPNMRGILLDWIIDLHHKFKMFPETLFTVAMIIDKYLMKKQVTKENLQLLGAAAFFIAAKYEETYAVPEAKELVHLSADSFTKSDLLRLQADILLTLDFNLIMNNTLKFMEPFVKLIKMAPKNVHLTQYILELSLLDMSFLKYKPSLLASAGIYLVNKIRRVDEIWPDILVGLTGYEEKDIKSCAKELCLMFENVDKMNNTKSLRRKFSLAKFHQVSKVRLERRN